MKRITLYEYLATNCPNDAKSVIEGFGYNVRARDIPDMVLALKQFVVQEKEKGLEALARIHPDRELILDSVKSRSADGFVATAPAPASSVKQAETNNQQPVNHHMQLLIAGIIGVGMLLSLTIIAKK